MHKNFHTESDEEWVLVKYEQIDFSGNSSEISNVYNEFTFEITNTLSKQGPVTGVEVGSNHANIPRTGFPNFGNSNDLRYTISFIPDDVKGATARGMIITIGKDSLTSSGYTLIEVTRDYFSLTKLNKTELVFRHNVSENNIGQELFTFEKRKK